MAETSEQHFRKMTETPVSRLVISLGIPTTISMLITSLYNMADTYFVGQIGTRASGAVGVMFGLMAIIQACGFMFGHGAGSIIARKLGEKNPEHATVTASTGFIGSLVAGGLITIFGLVFCDPLMRLLGSTETILPYSRTYGRFILMSAPVMTASCVLNNILRYEGRAFFAMIGLTSGGILNIFGDWLLISYFDMDVAGAGISTAVSQCVSFLILLYMFLVGKTQTKISIRKVARDTVEVIKIMKTGFPSLMRQGLNSVSTMVLNGYAGIYGDEAVAGMSIVNRICFFVFAVGLGLGQGFQPVCAFNYGAKRYTRVKKSFWFTVFAGEVMLGTFAVFGILLSSHLIGFFRNDPLVIKIGTYALRAQLISLFFIPLTVCANMMFQSVGANGRASFLSALRSGLCFIPTIILLHHILGLQGIEISQTVSDIVTFFVTLPFIFSFMKHLSKQEKERGTDLFMNM